MARQLATRVAVSGPSLRNSRSPRWPRVARALLWPGAALATLVRPACHGTRGNGNRRHAHCPAARISRLAQRVRPTRTPRPGRVPARRGIRSPYWPGSVGAHRPIGSVATRGQLAWIGTSWWLPADATCPPPHADGARL